MKKITYKDLSLPLKVAAIGGMVYLVFLFLGMIGMILGVA